MKIVLALTSLLFCFSISKTAYGEQPHQKVATIISFGETEEADQTTAIESPDSHTGSLFVMDALDVPVFKESKNPAMISAKIGTRFGILVQIDGGKPLQIAHVRTRWTHPRFSDGVTVEEWPSPMNIGIGRYAGWIIEDESELVEGKWTVEILYKGSVLAKQQFFLEKAE